ncbi:unknown [Eggerthella sp. CAG:368]|nr:unknown [Eggerthella sp. CAG:368]
MNAMSNVTNEERREVARKLRHVVNCCDQEPYYGVPDSEVFSILGVGLGTTDGFANEDDVGRLADLIDRPKCPKLIPNEMEGLVFCSNCGAEIGEYGVPNYCHNCGAEVKR